MSVPPEPARPALPWLPIALASGFGIVFVGGFVGSAFLLAGSDDAYADSSTVAAAEPESHADGPLRSNGGPAAGTPARGGQSSGQSSGHSSGAPNAGKADVPIEVYGASWCPACRAARRWLDGNGYRYTDYDIDHDAAARERLRRLNPRGSIPVIVVDSNRTFVGFDPQGLEGAIGEAARRRH